MSDELVPPGIGAEDWAVTPLAVRVLVLALLKRLAVLEEQIKQTSRNSSKPPSSDPPHASPRPKPPPSGRSVGGQRGPVGHGRKLLAVDQVDPLVTLKPTCCGTCGALLLGEDPAPVRHQVTELPRVEPEVTEYRQHTLTCLACGASTQADRPADMPSGSVGPRARALISYLTGRIGASQRDVEEVLETVFHTPIGLGSIPAQEDQVSAALAEPVNAVKDYVQQQPIQHVDETSWREKKTARVAVAEHGAFGVAVSGAGDAGHPRRTAPVGGRRDGDCGFGSLGVGQSHLTM